MANPAAIREVLAEEREWQDRAWFPPGPQLAVCLPGQDRLAALTDAELVEVIAAARRQTAWAQARELAAIAELSSRRHAQDPGDSDYRVLSAHQSLLEEVSAALTITGNAAATLVHLADRLTRQLPATHTALHTGQIDLPKARVICDAVDQLPDELCAQVETAVLPQAPGQTTGQLRRRTTTLVRRLAPEVFADRAQATVKDRRLELWDTATGTAGLALTDITATDAHAIHHKITAVARALKHDGDDRPLDQLRADLATELLRGHPLPDAVRTLIAEAAEPRPDTDVEAQTGGGSPGEDEAGGAPGPMQTVAVAEALAAVARGRLEEVQAHARATGCLDALADLTALAVQDLRDQLAEVRDLSCAGERADGHGHPGYRPTVALRRMVEQRHSTCVFPTCNTRSGRCDLDHTTAYDAHGLTCGCNLAPLCRRHHRAKQTRGWRLFQIWPGLLIWITPSGKWHITLPDRQ